MNKIHYKAPASLEMAIELYSGAGSGSKLLAGGTDLLVQMHADVIAPVLLVDLKKIPQLRHVEEEPGGYRIGAAVSGVEMMNHKAFCAVWPGVMDGVKLIGSLQVKGRASVGGNICNASPAADSVPPMIAAGALATVVGPDGTRIVPVEDIGVAPGRNSLQQGEIVVSFLLPNQPAGSGGAYQRFTPRTEMDIAVVGVAVNLTLDEAGLCSHARVALGAVAEKALLVKEAADALIGTPVDEHAIDNLVTAVSAACRPIDDKRGTREFRIKVAGVLARRVVTKALERAKGSGEKP
jgi:CO/xanthine dehydrogenase FAD-binding subunit